MATDRYGLCVVFLSSNWIHTVVCFPFSCCMCCFRFGADVSLCLCSSIVTFRSRPLCLFPFVIYLLFSLLVCVAVFVLVFRCFFHIGMGQTRIGGTGRKASTILNNV